MTSFVLNPFLQLDGLTYYKRERDKMKVRVAKELNRLPMKILQMAFVTFRNKFTAFQENLKRQPTYFTFKTLFINTAVFLIAVFLTTPTVILSSAAFLRSSQMQSNAVLRFIPTLLVWVLARAIAALVTYSSSYLDFETKCIFLPDNGAFFVNYVMTSAFVGNVLQLLRLPEVFMCMLGVMMSKSEAEKITIRKTYTWDFTYGVQYSHSLLMFTLVQFFSLLCPVISPFGLFYFMVKLAVDRYNICFASSPSRNSFKMHSLALKFIMFALCMKNLGLFFLIYIRGGAAPIFYTSEALAFLTILLCVFALNPCKVKFLPRLLLMPHQLYTTTYHDFLEDGLPSEKQVKVLPGEEEIFQPFSLRRYLCLLSPLDHFGNPIPVVSHQLSEHSDVSESADDSEETRESFCKD